MRLISANELERLLGLAFRILRRRQHEGQLRDHAVLRHFSTTASV